MRRIAVVIGSRANYGSIQSVMRAIHKHPGLKLQVIACASALLDRYGSVIDVMIQDGFLPSAKVHMLVEGETPLTMAKSTGLGLMELPCVFERLNPDIVLTVGDRFETMATAISAAYMNIPLAHTMGGEVSGTIDESIRHAVTKLAHIHFPACMEAYERIRRLGETQRNIHIVGCPRIDLVASVDGPPSQALFNDGIGVPFDLTKPFLMVSQHPVTTEYGEGERQITETLEAVHSVGLPAAVFWPNADAGSEDVARGIRKFRESHTTPMYFFKNLPAVEYIRLMKQTACLIGNSSSAIREGAYLGTPAVNIGTRQHGRQRGRNVMDTGYHCGSILGAIRHQLVHARYPSDPIYGDGHAGERIAQILATCELSVQKRITY